MKKYIALIFTIIICVTNSLSQYSTDIQFVNDSLIPFSGENIIIRYAKHNDERNFNIIKEVILDSLGIVKINAKPGIYKYYWKRYGMNKYITLWGIPVTHKDKLGAPRQVKMEWFERTFLPIKDEKLSNEDNVYLADLVNFLKNKQEIRVEILGHYQGMDSEKSNLNQSSLLSNKIKNYLVLNGINKDRISTRGNGSLDKKALGKRKFVVELIELNELSK